MDNAEKIRNTAYENLQTQLNKIRENELHLKELDTSKQQDGIKENADVFVQYLKGKCLQIQTLKQSINAYSNDGHHFTKQYRTLEGHCGKLQTELDRIDVSGREDLRVMRKNALLEVNGLLQELVKKAHSSGVVCPKCEVQR